MRVTRRLFPDPDLCTRCQDPQGAHRSQVVYPVYFGNQLARPCIRVKSQGRGVRNCGCPDFVPVAPWFLRLLNVLVSKIFVDMLWIIFGVGLVGLAMRAPMWTLSMFLIIAMWAVACLGLHLVVKHWAREDES